MEIRDIFARNMNITTEIRDRFSKLEYYFIFRGKDLKYIFMLCLALGYRKGIKKEAKNAQGMINTTSFSDEDLFTIAAIAVDDTKNIETLRDGPLMRKIALEYVNAGLNELENLASEYGTGENLELAIEEMTRKSVEKN